MLGLLRGSNRITKMTRGAGQPEHRKLRKRNPENRAAQKLKRRQSKNAQFTVDKLDYTSHPWFTVTRIKAVAEHLEQNLNHSWRRNNVDQKDALEFVKKQKAIEKHLVKSLKSFANLFSTKLKQKRRWRQTRDSQL